jgi:hypothetical protein
MTSQYAKTSTDARVTDQAVTTEDSSPRFRSAAVARMTGIAVATLRVWERRYRVIGPLQSAAGHRLYSSTDVRRLGLIRALIDRGHAIGTLAPLDDMALQSLLVSASASASASAGLDSGAVPALVPPPAVPRIWALGRALPAAVVVQAGRLSATPVLRTWTELVQAEAAAAALTTGPGAHEDDALDLLAVELDTLNLDHADRLLALRGRVSARQTLVVYGFGSDTVVQRLRRLGVTMWRGPLGQVEMGLLLQAVLGLTASGGGRAPAATAAPSPPRLSPEALALAARSTSRVLCECPRHLAELIQMLGDFEDYSAHCATDSPADRPLHDELGIAARQARATFEQALRRLAAEEGWSFPILETS